jgi:hypothetical protein
MDGYKPKIRVLKTVDTKGRLGTLPKPTGNALRQKQLRSRVESQNDKLLDEIEELRAANARWRGLLEGIIRTHGEQVLDVDFLNESCTHGAIEVIQRPPNFVVVKLPAPKVVEDPSPPQFPPTDDPFVANLTPDARIAYEAAYAKAMEEAAGLVRLK